MLWVYSTKGGACYDSVYGIKGGAVIFINIWGGFAMTLHSIKGGAEWLLDARLSNLCPLDSLSSRRLLPLPPLIIPPPILNIKI